MSETATVLNQAQSIERVKNNHPLVFKKFGDFTYEIAKEQHDVVTSINGEVETKNTAYPGDYVLTGASGEKYVLKPDNFNKRYENLGDGKCRATGKCYGNVWEGEPFKLMAPWGEEMICNTGDYLVSPDAEFSEAYRIEKETFAKTYKLA